MFLRLISATLLLSSMIVTGKLVYDGTIFEFWTRPWAAGIISAFILLISGVSISFRNEDEVATLAFFIFGLLYTAAAVVVYSAWAYLHIRGLLSVGAFWGYALLWTMTGSIGFLCLAAWFAGEDALLFRFAGWSYALVNLGALLGVVYKYVFAVAPWLFWPFLGEVVIISAGAAVFLKCHDAAEAVPAAKSQARRR